MRSVKLGRQLRTFSSYRKVPALVTGNHSHVASSHNTGAF
jgi:hypothetical protein